MSCRFSTAISTITTATDRGHDGNNGDGDGSRQYHHHHHTAQPTQPPSKRRRTTPEATARLEEIKSICTHNSIIMVTLVSGACIPIDEYRQTPSNLARLQAFYNSTRATEHMRRLYCSAIANQSQ